MSRATVAPRARSLTALAALVLVAIGAVLAVGTKPAQAAKPCWERVIDDWVDNGRIDGVYSARCIAAAREHVPEDIRTYTDIIDKLDAYRQAIIRTPQSTGGPGSGSGSGSSSKSDNKVKPSSKTPEPEPDVGPEKDEGPISSALGYKTDDASSIPLPLIVLAGLALLLMAAGGAGFAHRKLQARRASSRDS